MEKVNLGYLIGPRIREERKRLRLTQSQLADGCGVSRVVWGRYERGQAIPGSGVLFAFAKLGAEVGYILTGHRNGDNLQPREAKLLDNYRAADEEGRRAIERAAFAIAEQDLKCAAGKKKAEG